jgi:late competence protein required for DNA uptake (superfamily II DNA/RNA helicase)
VVFLKNFFRDQRINVLAMHSQMSVNVCRTCSRTIIVTMSLSIFKKRRQVLNEFRQGENNVLCATDILSRGIDTHWVD